jgi:hypothetical protein
MGPLEHLYTSFNRNMLELYRVLVCFRFLEGKHWSMRSPFYLCMSSISTIDPVTGYSRKLVRILYYWRPPQHSNFNLLQWIVIAYRTLEQVGESATYFSVLKFRLENILGKCAAVIVWSTIVAVAFCFMALTNIQLELRVWNLVWR